MYIFEICDSLVIFDPNQREVKHEHKQSMLRWQTQPSWNGSRALIRIHCITHRLQCNCWSTSPENPCLKWDVVFDCWNVAFRSFVCLSDCLSVCSSRHISFGLTAVHSSLGLLELFICGHVGHHIITQIIYVVGKLGTKLKFNYNDSKGPINSERAATESCCLWTWSCYAQPIFVPDSSPRPSLSTSNW